MSNFESYRSSEMYMDSSLFARDFVSDIRRVCIFGFSMETLSPSPQCMRTLVPLWVVGLVGLVSDQVSPGRISFIRSWSLAELLFLAAVQRSSSQWITLVFSILGQHRPGCTDVLVSQCNSGFALTATLDDGAQPMVLGRLRFLQTIHVGPGTLD